ncbi:hypothetical protein D3C85_902510 [compost metagenome]
MASLHSQEGGGHIINHRFTHFTQVVSGHRALFSVVAVGGQERHAIRAAEQVGGVFKRVGHRDTGTEPKQRLMGLSALSERGHAPGGDVGLKAHWTPPALARGVDVASPCRVSVLIRPRVPRTSQMTAANM